MEMRNFFFVVIMVFFLAIIPFFVKLPIYLLALLNLLLIYMLISLGWNIIGGLMNYYSFGHGAFFGIGAYTVAILMRDYRAPPMITLPIAALVASTIALIVGYPSLRLKGVYFTFSTISLNYIFMLTFTLAPWAGPLGITLPLHPLEPYLVEIITYGMLFIAVLGSILLTFWIKRSHLGLAIFAIGCDEDAAKVRGINTTKYKLLAFILSAIPPALSGGIYTYYFLYIDPVTVFSSALSISAIASTLLGGAGLVFGPVIGTSIYMILLEIMRYMFPEITGLHIIFSSIIMLCIIIIMPRGILGEIKEKFRLRVP